MASHIGSISAPCHSIPINYLRQGWAGGLVGGRAGSLGETLRRTLTYLGFDFLLSLDPNRKHFQYCLSCSVEEAQTCRTRQGAQRRAGGWGPSRGCSGVPPDLSSASGRMLARLGLRRTAPGVNWFRPVSVKRRPAGHETGTG